MNEKELCMQELTKETKATAGDITQELFALIKVEYVCKDCEKAGEEITFSLFNGQKFRVCVQEV